MFSIRRSDGHCPYWAIGSCPPGEPGTSGAHLGKAEASYHARTLEDGTLRLVCPGRFRATSQGDTGPMLRWTTPRSVGVGVTDDIRLGARPLRRRPAPWSTA